MERDDSINTRSPPKSHCDYIDEALDLAGYRELVRTPGEHEERKAEYAELNRHIGRCDYCFRIIDAVLEIRPCAARTLCALAHR